MDDIEHYVLTFVGGDMDGLVLDSRSSRKRERTVVEMFLGASYRGQTGLETRSLVSYWAVLHDQMSGPPQQGDQANGRPETRIHAYKAISRSVSQGVCHLMVNHTIVDFLPGFQCRMVERAERPGFFVNANH
jgi:hypothetical protein